MDFQKGQYFFGKTLTSFGSKLQKTMFVKHQLKKEKNEEAESVE